MLLIQRSLRSSVVSDRTPAIRQLTVQSMSKPRTAVDETSKEGAFKRTAAVYRNFIEKGTQFEPEGDRYHLYISYACPWASRCEAVRQLKGLDHVIGLSVVHPVWQRTRPSQDEHAGWTFKDPSDPPGPNQKGFGSFDNEGCVPDTINNAKFVRDLYELCNDTGGKYTVPVLWDKKLGTIVNNESVEIIRMFNSSFNDFARNPKLDLYPKELASKIDEVNEWIYHSINNGVYKCGFATSQSAYEEAFKGLFQGLDRCEDILSKQRYIAGDVFTEADIRLFVTLIRFDEVYVVYFKTNKKLIHEYPHLSNYVKEIYQMPKVKATVNMKHIKTHYYCSHPRLNYYAIVPVGGDPWQEESHNRDDLFPLKTN